VPTSTDLVKDGAVAIETLGDSIDASLLDLKGGTTGQVLAKASGTDMDFSWVAIDPLVILDAKGDLITATAADTPARLAVGTNGQTLVADSTASTGLKWATPASGMTKITSGTFSNVASVAIDSVFSSTYKNYVAVITVGAVTSSDDLQLQMRYAGPTTQTTSYYGSQFEYDRSNTLFTAGYSNTAQATLLQSAGESAGLSCCTINFSQVGNTSQTVLAYGNGLSNYLQNTANFSMLQNVARIYTGFLLKSSSTNITGTYAVYGLEA
jgi:hypothetical protein